MPNAAAAIGRSLLPLAIGIVIAIALQFGAKPVLGAITDGADYWAKILLDVLTGVILAVSLTMVNGFTGQFSIGHAAFMAVGAYTAACIVYYGSFRIWGDAAVHGGTLSTMMEGRTGSLLGPGDLLFVVALIAGGLTASLCGYLVGLPSLRLKGDYLAIVTLGFGEIVRVAIQQTSDTLYEAEEIAATPAWKFPKYIGGGLGFSGLPFYTSLFWTGLLAAVTLIVAYRLKTSSAGRAFLSIREDEIAAESMGVHTTRYKVRAFVLAAFFAGIAGGLFAHTNGVQLNPTELGFMKSFDIIIMVVLGGLGSISGASIAASILAVLSEFLRDPPSVWPVGIVAGIVFALCAAPFSKHRLRPAFYIALMLGGWELVRWLAGVADIRLSDYRMVIYALALVGMMIMRPQGLLGIREIWEIRPVKGRWRI
jgi:branched-chain amino acid transport system permease protein